MCTDVIDDITESKEAEQLQENDKDGLMEERDLPLSSLHTNSRDLRSSHLLNILS